MTDIQPDQMDIKGEPVSRYTIKLPSLGILYGFWATMRLELNLPDRYLEAIKIDGSYTDPLCKVWAGGRLHVITIKQLHRKAGLFRRHPGLKLWSWRAKRLKAAKATIIAALQKAKKDWDTERYDRMSETTGGRKFV